MKFWTNKEVERLAELYKTHTLQEISVIMNRSLQALKGASQRYKIVSGRTGRFPAGHVPHNAGTKGVHLGGVETQFKKGHKPHNTRTDGATTLRADGYMWIRVGENKWEQLHRYIWACAYGEIDKNLILVFRNGDKTDMRLDNLELITRREHARRNHNRDKARVTMRELYRRERLRKKYGMPGITKHSERIVNYW